MMMDNDESAEEFFTEVFNTLEDLLEAERTMARNEMDSEDPDITVAISCAEIVALTEALLNKLYEYGLDPRPVIEVKEEKPVPPAPSNKDVN